MSPPRSRAPRHQFKIEPDFQFYIAFRKRRHNCAFKETKAKEDLTMSEETPGTEVENKTPKKRDALDKIIPILGAVIIMAAAFAYSNVTDVVANDRKALMASIETLDHDPRNLGKDELPRNHWDSTSGYMGDIVTYKDVDVAAGCLLAPSLQGQKYIPVGYTINPFLNTISTVHSLGWYGFDDDLNARFKKTCDAFEVTYPKA